MDEVDAAARRTAINLMRLNEALDEGDADGYSQALNAAHVSHRRARRLQVRNYYKRWFASKALRRIP